MYESEISGVRSLDWSFQFSDFGFRISIFGRNDSKSGLRMMKLEKVECGRDREITIRMNLIKLENLGFEFRISISVSLFGFHFSVFGFQISLFGFQYSGFCFQISISRFQFSDLGSQFVRI